MPAIPQPYSNKPIPDWITDLQHSESAESRLRALQAIGHLSPKAESSQWAAYAIRDNDSDVRALAAKLLGSNPSLMPGETESALVAMLDDADPDSRFESARALIRWQTASSERAVAVLLQFLDEEETQPLMIAAVVNTLLEVKSLEGPGEAMLQPRIERYLDHDRAEVRESISAVFRKWPTMCKPVIDRLLPLLDDSEPVVRENIACALGSAGLVDENIRTALQAATLDEDSEVARIAAEALQKLRV